MAVASVKEEKKEEVEEVDMGNLFGGDDDGYWLKFFIYYTFNITMINYYLKIYNDQNMVRNFA